MVLENVTGWIFFGRFSPSKYIIDRMNGKSYIAERKRKDRCSYLASAGTSPSALCTRRRSQWAYFVAPECRWCQRSHEVGVNQLERAFDFVINRLQVRPPGDSFPRHTHRNLARSRLSSPRCCLDTSGDMGSYD